MFTIQEIGTQRSWKLSERETLTIGRLPGNRVRLSDLKVSRRHAEVKLTGWKQAVVVNVSEDNVVRINEKRVPPRGGSLALQDGDQLKVGPVMFKVSWKGQDPLSFSDAPLSMSATMSPVNNAGAEVLLSSSSSGSQRSLQADLRRKAEMLVSVCDMTADLLRVDNVKTILEYAADVVMRTLSVDCCSGLLLEADGTLTTVCLRFRNKAAEQRNRTISRTAVTTAIEQKVLLSAPDVQESEVFSQSDSVSLQGIGALLCAPLAGREDVYGALYADRRPDPEPFSETDQKMLMVVAMQAATAIEATRARAREASEVKARAAFARFMPEHLMRELTENPDKYQLGGVNKRISILFSDVRGFSTIAHGMRPEQVVEMLNTLFTELSAEITSHDGTLNKYLGDGIMALFGAPVSAGQDAVNAVNAAIAMQRATRGVNKTLQARGLPILDIGIGINTGEVTVGVVGAEMRSEYTAIGSAVNIASRVEGITGAGQIFITQATVNELGGQFTLAGPYSKELRHIPGTVLVYNVVYDEIEETDEFSVPLTG